MVKRTPDGFVIEVACGSHPANDYTEITTGLIELLQSNNKDFNSETYHVLALLKEMMPTFDQAKCMFDN